MDSLVAEELYAQTASAVSTIRAIVDGYPLSAGIIREIVQNSDDAGASKQSFVLDQRTHVAEGLCYQGLASAQGPAFMAFNDEILREKDWEALKCIHDSSKAADQSKIGKYGVGFRSVFNLTDSPQILSDKHLAIFDPLCLYLGSEGVKKDLEGIASSSPNQLSSFRFFMENGHTSPFPGTVIRCPLRTAPSRISDQVIRIETISELFKEFIDQELEISCLFLKNIKSIELYEVDSTGVTNLLAKMTISRSDPVSSMSTVTVELTRDRITETKEWFIGRSNFSREEVEILMQLTEDGVETVMRTLQGAKLSPDVKIAVDITRAVRGRLFTYLPLPIFTGFPVHIHSLFAIDTSRAHLRSAGVGLMSGSQDHAKVQWNRMLFETCIPRTWSHLLTEAVARRLVSDVYSIWPPERSSGELECYYSQFSKQFVKSLLAAKADVWPVYEPRNGPSQFRNLEALVVASPVERECVLEALARVGLSFTRPQKYVFELLRDSSETLSILSPEVARRLLLDKLDRIDEASEDHGLLLEYLLSSKNVLNICDLPLVPVKNGRKVTLTNVPGAPVYTLLTRSEFEIFGLCDDSAVPLQQLPPHAATTLLELGPASVNVQSLTVLRIVEYLATYSKQLTPCLSEARPDSTASRWLSNFWGWMNTYEHSDELFSKIQNLCLLPSTKGLMRADSALFRPRGDPPAYTTGYRALGVPFLAFGISEAAEAVLQHYDLAKSIRDIPALLDALESIHPAEISPPECEGVLKHLGSILDESISQERIQRLRNLPVFPILTCATTGNSLSVVTKWTVIPQGHAVRSVGRPRIVPLVDGMSFVGLDNIAPALVKFLEPSHPDSMSDNDLIELAVENFSTQPEHLRLDLLRHITDNRTRIIPDILNKLSSQAFVLAEDDTYHVPGDIVDPESDVGRLYVGCPAYQPSRSISSEIVRCLRSLGLLRAQLNPEITAERVEFISSRNSWDEALPIARNLLRLLGSSAVEFSRVQGITEKKWLPTNQGLCSADECQSAALTPLALFDKVLATLEPCTISPNLQTVLCWDQPLRIDLLVRQLDCLLNSECNYDAVVEVVKEFGRRQWNDEDLVSLSRTVRDRQWIPTTTGDILADVKSSVFHFSLTMVNSGFYQVKTDLKAEVFLRQMGCTDHPTTRAILDKLHLLQKDSNHVDVLGISISLLRSLPDGFTNEQRDEFLIPDKDSQLRPFAKVFYNDIGENHRLVNNDGDFIAHPSLDESLVQKLGLNRLGLRYADLRNLGPNMGQAPITTVRRTLQQYTNQQFLLEFLANAEDAKATEFTVAVNLVTVHKERPRVLSPAYLCKLPSLVVHNNARFSQQDFDGICQTSVGGKEGRVDTIGEFGLGVLTMYHFTDMAIIISGSQVLFLDPSKKHLPREDSAAIILPLHHVQQCYGDQLVTLHGLFDFDMGVGSYNGTLFVLPLRQQPHEFIAPDFWPPERIFSEILDPFGKFAGDCLLFTGIEMIECVTRSPEGVVTPCWSFRAQKTPATIGLEPGYVVTNVEITKSAGSMVHWKTVRTSCLTDQLPSEFQRETSLTRKQSFAGLAARMDGTSSENYSKFFSILPLSTTTTLSMHVMASFKLSSDRRQIRLDGVEELPRRYNSWLLEEVIPPLYLFFLEHLLLSEDRHYHVRWPTDKGDTLSNHIVNSFYSKHLTSSRRRIFSSVYAPLLLLSPHEAILQVNEPYNLRRIVDLLAPHHVADLPSGPRKLAEGAKLPTIDPKFIKEEILRNPEAITSDNDFGTIHDVILYLTHQTDGCDILRGLAILPLEDGSFAKLDTRGADTSYYLWRPKNHKIKHNFDESHFVHPEMKTRDLEKFKLNYSLLNPTAIKNFIEAKLSTFPKDSLSSAQIQWTDSFWGSWEEYKSLKLETEHITRFPLVQTIPPPDSPFSKLVTLEGCKNGEVLLVEGDSPTTQGLRSCFRALGLPVVHIDGQIPNALCAILKNYADYPRMKFENVLSAIERTGRPIQDLFGSLDDELREVFAQWARQNITSEISDEQIAVARTLPIWPSAGGRAPNALRSASEVQLLPQGLTLEDVAAFVDTYIADDAALLRLNVKYMTLDKLREQLLLPTVLDENALPQYKCFYEKWMCTSPSVYHSPLPVPTCARTLQEPQGLFRREPLFTAVFPEDGPFFIHRAFEDVEKKLPGGLNLKSEKQLDMETFTTCALRANDLTRAREVFRAFSEILPTRVTKQPDTWRELNEIPFIPRSFARTRKLPEQDENESGLEIPPEVTHLDAIVRPVEVVRKEFEAVAWSQRGSFESQPESKLYIEYPDLGKPDFSEVIAHLRFLSRLSNLHKSQYRVLLHDVKKVYQYLNDEGNLKCLKEKEGLAQTIFSALRDEPLLLNIDDDEETLNWVRGNNLAIDCHHREGSMQGVRAFLRPFEDILKAAGAVKVHHPNYKPKLASQQSESGIWSIFNRMRREKVLTDVVFIVEPSDEDLNAEPLVAHRSFLAVSSKRFEEFFCEKSQDACPGCPLPVKVSYSWPCVRSFLDFVYTRNKGGNDFSLELLLEILDMSNHYKVMDLFDEVQAEIFERRLLRPDTVDKIKSCAKNTEATGLANACAEYEYKNAEFIKSSKAITQMCVPPTVPSLF